MSVANAGAFVEWAAGESEVSSELTDATPTAFIEVAARHGYEFSEADIASLLRARLHAAESLPRPWGWPLARRLGLVRG